MQYSELYIQDVERSLQQVPNLHLLYGHSVLVTGATGLIGSCVVDALLYLNKYQDAGIIIMIAGRNRERVIQRFSQYEIGKDYLFLHYDAASTEPLSVKADYIIHAAGRTQSRAFVEEPADVILRRLRKMKDNGIHTILAHPERYWAIQQDWDLAKRICDLGINENAVRITDVVFDVEWITKRQDELRKEINETQDAIDEYNATHYIDVFD